MKTLYIDLDGVVANFHQVASAQLGIPVSTSFKLTHHHWETLDPRIYKSLPKMPHARELVNECKQVAAKLKINIAFLTAIPRPYTMPYATVDKIKWCEEHFPNVDVFIGPYTRDKIYFCKNRDILIDDNELTVREWNAAAGVGLHFQQYTPQFVQTLQSLV